MSIEIYLQNKLEFKENCVFCDFALRDVGEKDNRAVKIFETGKDPDKDWYGLLQFSVVSDPNTEFRILLLPTGHLSSFLSRNRDLASNYGIATFVLSEAMQQIRAEEGSGLFEPSQIIYSKCFTPENTQEHLHIKIDEFSGGLAQAFPPDAGWLKKVSRAGYIQTRAATKTRLTTERTDSLAERLINYIMN